MAAAKKSTGKDKTPFLQTYSPVRPYGRHEMNQIFVDMKSEMKKVSADGFYKAATSIGTHAPKLASSRNKTQALHLKSGSANRPGKLAASGNGAYAPYMKVLLRPIAIMNESGQYCMFERMQSGDAGLIDAFEKVFGRDARIELENGLADRALTPSPSLTRENYPVFFLPGKDGGDLQASPGGSIEAHTNMKSMMFSMRSQAKKDREEKRAATYGDWSVLTFADKAQNVIIGAPIDRTRFKASFPGTLNEIEADIWRFRKTGQFPRLRDRDAANTLVEFALACQRFDDRDTYRGGDIKERQVDNRAKFLVLRARHFIDDIHQALLSSGMEKEDLPSPEIKGILSRLNIKGALAARPDVAGLDAAKVILSLHNSDFGYALQKYGQ